MRSKRRSAPFRSATTSSGSTARWCRRRSCGRGRTIRSVRSDRDPPQRSRALGEKTVTRGAQPRVHTAVHRHTRRATLLDAQSRNECARRFRTLERAGRRDSRRRRLIREPQVAADRALTTSARLLDGRPEFTDQVVYREVCLVHSESSDGSARREGVCADGDVVAVPGVTRIFVDTRTERHARRRADDDRPRAFTCLG